MNANEPPESGPLNITRPDHNAGSGLLGRIYEGAPGANAPIVSATKENSVVETKAEGTLSLPFAPIWNLGLQGRALEPERLRSFPATTAGA
jgi:hypothetical protein